MCAALSAGSGLRWWRLECALLTHGEMGRGPSGGAHYISLNKGYDKDLLKVCTCIYLAHQMHWLKHCVYFIAEYHMLPVVFPQCHRVLQSTMKQTSRQTVVFPGFSLTLHGTDREAATPVETAASCSAVLRDVGLPESRCAQPTHLEVVQIVDTSSLPLFWLSPLHCTLYPPSLHTGCAGAFSLWVSLYACIHVVGHTCIHVLNER